MDGYQFISSLADSLAWPLAVIVGVILLRKPLIGLLERVKSLKSGDHSIEFSEVLLEARVNAAQIEHIPAAERPDLSREIYLFRGPVGFDVTPELLVLNAWAATQIAVVDLAKSLNWEAASKTAVPVLVKRLEDEGIIDDAMASVMRDLRRLRNMAAHPEVEQKVDMGQAQQVLELAASVVAVLRQKTKKGML